MAAGELPAIRNATTPSPNKRQTYSTTPLALREPSSVSACSASLSSTHSSNLPWGLLREISKFASAGPSTKHAICISLRVTAAADLQVKNAAGVRTCLSCPDCQVAPGTPPKNPVLDPVSHSFPKSSCTQPLHSDKSPRATAVNRPSVFSRPTARVNTLRSPISKYSARQLSQPIIEATRGRMFLPRYVVLCKPTSSTLPETPKLVALRR